MRVQCYPITPPGLPQAATPGWKQHYPAAAFSHILDSSKNQGRQNSMEHPVQPPSIDRVLELPRLDLGADQIRILTLRRGSWNDAISCDLEIARLQSNPQYEALSYAWGDATVRAPIILDGCMYQVTTNLEAALRRLRHPTRDRRLWVDALCINQADDAEKSHQVNLMSHIYSNAAHGLMWLGEHEEDSPLHHLSQPAQQNRGVTASITRSEVIAAFGLIRLMGSGCHVSSRVPDEGENLDSVYHLEAPSLNALATLMGLDWWKRIWTVQEVVLPANVTVICGDMQLDWAVFSQAAINFVDHIQEDCCNIDYEAGVGLARFHFAIDPISICRRRGYQGANYILETLWLFQGRRASDERDKIYALLGLGPTPLLCADYSLGWREVYCAAAESLLRTPAIGLQALLRRHEYDRDLDLPSWVPDWRAQTEQDLLSRELAWFNFYDGFNAAGGTKFTSKPSHSAELYLLGTAVDDVATSLGRPHATADDLETDTHWRGLLEDMVNLTDNYPYGWTYIDAYFRTVRCGMSMLPATDGSFARLHPGDSSQLARVRDWEAARGLDPVLLGTSRQRLFLTKSGLLGMGPEETRPGDKVYILHGGNVPFVLRPASQQGLPDRYTYVGDAYVDGVMDGEALDDGSTAAEWVALV
ncbi:heterokaryon incompatibility protein-domain-containing protein [Cercophora newfieldiana]|uniref:Heterokaryon incompatibility protein-domain-containing protein n=1 Tax=Cercophora newfieldiana TaxID=92897 RepID=A0AA39XXZ3_9PEZI|nr:heterokaryon incompatibility protein-domain-containing protein [Cercophora newfieldiana]